MELPIPTFPSPGSFIIEQPTSGRPLVWRLSRALPGSPICSHYQAHSRQRYPKLLHCQNANTLDSQVHLLNHHHRDLKRASLSSLSIIAHQQFKGRAESFSLSSPSFIAHQQFQGLCRELLSAVSPSSHIGFEGVWILGQELLLAILPSHISN